MIIGSKNKGKIEEIIKISEKYGLKYAFQTCNDLSIPEIIENGNSFAENSIIKASEIFKLYGKPVITDDSGLCVDFLKGFPGIFSSRYSGGGDNKNISKLLIELKNIPVEKRQAKFFCYVCYCFDYNSYLVFSGEIHGIIIDERRGENGFGYDPVFYLPQYKKTMAELSSQEKNSISHRAQAFDKLFKHLSEKF